MRISAVRKDHTRVIPNLVQSTIISAPNVMPALPGHDKSTALTGSRYCYLEKKPA